MKPITLNLLIVLLFSSAVSFGQATKLNKTFKTADDVKVSVNAAHTNIMVDTWNKNVVEITAFIESEDLDDQKRKELLKDWNLKVKSENGIIKINSGGGLPIPPAIDLQGLEEPLTKLPELMVPLMEMINPILQNIAENPLPPELMDSLGNFEFDYEAYQEEGEAYLEKWEEQMNKNLGKDFEQKMEAWAANFEQDMEDSLWQKEIEIKMEAWGEDFGKSMEKWGEEFGKNMEVWAENFGRQMEAQFDSVGENKLNIILHPSEAKKTIRIKMPETGTLDLDVRHGKVILKGKTENLQAELSHSQFSAEEISGKKTRVKASYTPVNVEKWNYGILTLGYVKNAKIGVAKSLKLNSNSSDMEIGKVMETGIISGTFGDLDINELSPNFDLLDINLENTDLQLNLPETAFIFNYNGSQSDISYPETITAEPMENYDSKIINGYQKSKSATGTVNITARFSDVDID